MIVKVYQYGYDFDEKCSTKVLIAEMNFLVLPRQGDVIYFESQDGTKDFTADVLSVHHHMYEGTTAQDHSLNVRVEK